jgi:hypothetical protein
VADARSESFDSDEHGVLVAVGGDFLNDELVARRFTLEPELLARAAVEGGEAGVDGLAECFVVHEAEHEDAAGRVVLDDGWDEAAVEFREVEIHRVLHKRNKKPARTAAGVSSKYGVGEN